MLTSIAVFLYIAIFLSFLYRYVIYPQFLSPLSKLPRAHPTTAVLPTWLWYQQRTQNESRSITEAHHRHGPVVLVSPSEVSVASLDGLKKIYSGRRFKRPDWFVTSFLNYNGTKNLVTMPNTNEHAKRKKAMLQILVKSFVFRSADFQKLSAVILLERFLPVLNTAATNKQGIDVFELLRAVAAEIGSAYEVGLHNCLDITRHGREQEKKTYIEHTFNKMHEKNDHLASKKWLELQLLEILANTDAELKDIKASAEARKNPDYTFPLAYSHLDAATTADYPALSTSQKLTLVASELLDNLEASREGDGVILTYVLHEISQKLDVQRALRAEIEHFTRHVEQSAQSRFFDVEVLQTLDRLPLLDAILKETMRLRSPAPGPQRRVVPAGGITVDGYFVPEDTIIGTSQRAIHRIPEVFPDPDDWKPERWLSSTADKDLGDRDPSKWWWGFGSGAMSCSGKDFAWIGMFNYILTCNGAHTFHSHETHPRDHILQL
jgi:cytochrome P450